MVTNSRPRSSVRDPTPGGWHEVLVAWEMLAAVPMRSTRCVHKNCLLRWPRPVVVPGWVHDFSRIEGQRVPSMSRASALIHWQVRGLASVVRHHFSLPRAVLDVSDALASAPASATAPVCRSPLPGKRQTSYRPSFASTTQGGCGPTTTISSRRWRIGHRRNRRGHGR